MEFLCTVDELDVDHTIFGGQAFRWRREDDGARACVLWSPDGPVLVRLIVAGTDILTSTIPDGRIDVVRDYFRLDVDLAALTAQFIAADPSIAPAAATFPGLRILRQDPGECLFSFICSSAAPLHRIRKNITRMCETYGEEFAGCKTFPTVDAIANADHDVMFGFGLGYRAKFLIGSAREVLDRGGESWLRGLRHAPYADARAALMALPGVGAKVADCVSLFSLDKDDAIPGDTHVRQMVERHYAPELAGKSLTPTVYAAIGDALRNRFGPMAGWAQQYLFYEDLFEKRAWAAYEKQLG
jgi:N-glycosylase/DNA lyase